MGGAELSLPAPGLGVIWWLEIEPEHRRRGLGRQLLRAARTGAWPRRRWTEVVLFVDHDDPKARDRRPALELYLAEGFTVVDHLWSYRRGEGEAEPGGDAGAEPPDGASVADVDDDPGRAVLRGDLERALLVEADHPGEHAFEVARPADLLDAGGAGRFERGRAGVGGRGGFLAEVGTGGAEA